MIVTVVFGIIVMMPFAVLFSMCLYEDYQLNKREKRAANFAKESEQIREALMSASPVSDAATKEYVDDTAPVYTHNSTYFVPESLGVYMDMKTAELYVRPDDSPTYSWPKSALKNGVIYLGRL